MSRLFVVRNAALPVAAVFMLAGLQGYSFWPCLKEVQETLGFPWYSGHIR